ncbi:glycyl-radical enzyme activating protein family [Thermanaerovibrio acidaminovorans DSM 6589]|uniref:Glycyl-radical enzyme activating protein family n=1 Tax=Thermanaerovibrio acidaminovorans (strain ATCC 49978 / DSM 6589 / Su883) TaxID=525903 RepID=D1B6M7_THEAS|nr:glycyl-radical enzyme activating protein [Thermanaerovibrio acidaminovorans]ACZ19668.1 glycyl-radical enzyme activating protein family [Thermanaerovibrio acidaminovorans DSM 6589]
MVKGLVFDVKRYSIHDGPGIRTTFHLKGCPLRCRWCHNPEGLDFEPSVWHFPERCVGCGRCALACPAGAISYGEHLRLDRSRCVRCGMCAQACPADAMRLLGWAMTPRELLAQALKDEIFYDQSGGGVTLSGGEPLSQGEFLLESLELLKSCGIHTAVDTSGYAPVDLVLRVSHLSDLILYDLKHMDDRAHRLHTGVSNVPILENLKALAEEGANVWVRFPMIPAVNDSPGNLSAMGEFLASIGIRRLSVLPYHSAGLVKGRRLGEDLPLEPFEGDAPSKERIAQVVECLEGMGLEVKVGG